MILVQISTLNLARSREQPVAFVRHTASERSGRPLKRMRYRSFAMAARYRVTTRTRTTVLHLNERTHVSENVDASDASANEALVETAAAGSARLRSAALRKRK